MKNDKIKKRILGIETSCDETAISILEFSGSKARPRVKVLSNVISSQVKLHAKFGGVVPNLAKREHQRNLPKVLLMALKEAAEKDLKFRIYDLRKDEINNIRKSKFLNLKSVFEREPELLERFRKYVLPIKPPKVDAIAVTVGPGLAPALWVGVNFAKALSLIWDKPVIPVNHMEGHVYSALLQKNTTNPKFKILNCQYQNSKLKTHKSLEFRVSGLVFPALALLVSGGHTELVLMRGHGKYKIIGETLDDAAGEAFDKVARLLGLGYPGGPHIAALAEKFKIQNSEFRIRLPRPMINSNDYNFSFSGLKTAVLYLINDISSRSKSGTWNPSPGLEKLKPQIAHEFQNAVVDVLVAKTIRATKEFKAETVIIGGGVAANKLLRQRIGEELVKNLPGTSYRLPITNLTGDNALMIALAAHFQWASLAPREWAAYFSKNKKAPIHQIEAMPNLRLGEDS